MAKPSQDSQLLVLSCVSTVPAVGGVTVMGLGPVFREAWWLGSLHCREVPGLEGVGRASVSAGFCHEQSWSVRTLRLE